MKLSDKLNVEKSTFASKRMRVVTLPVRTEIIRLLDENNSLNVTQIYKHINLPQAEASNHLILMRNYGILNKVRKGKENHYSLNRKGIEDIIKYSEELTK